LAQHDGLCGVPVALLELFADAQHHRESRLERGGALLRGDLVALTALSGMTVSNVCRRLVDAGLVTESVLPAAGRGKPPKIVRLDPDGGFAIGVHIDPAVVTYVVVDLAGQVRDHVSTHTPTVQHPARVVGEMVVTIEKLLDESGVDRSKLLGIGVAALVLPNHAGSWGVTGGILALIGYRILQRGIPPIPSESIDSLQKDYRAIRGIGKRGTS